MARIKLPSSVVVGEWMVAILLTVNLVWTTLCLGGYRPETMALSWPLTAIALATQLGFDAWNGKRPHPAGLLFLPFLGYAAFNVAAVSPVPWLGWRDWFGWFQMIAVFWTALNGMNRSGPRAVVLGSLLVLGTIAVLLAAFQRFVEPDWLMLGRTQAVQFLGRSSGPFGIPNTLAAFLLLLIPPALALMLQRGATPVERVFWGYFAAVFLFGLGLTISRGAWISLVLVLIGWPLCARHLNLQTRVLLAVTALAGALLVGLILYSSAPKVKDRIDTLVADVGERSRPILWGVSFRLFLDAPVLGTGGGSYNTLFERYRPDDFQDEPQWAHNDYLNTLSDYGALGFLLFFGAIVAIVVCIGRKAPDAGKTKPVPYAGWLAPSVSNGLILGLVAFALSLFVDFHFKIPGLAMAVAVLAGEVVRRTWTVPAERSRDIRLRVGCLAAGFVIVLFALGVVLPIYRAEAARYRGRQSIDRMAAAIAPSLNEQRRVLTDAAFAFGEAVRLDSHNAQAWADRAYVTELWARLASTQMNDLGRDAEAAIAQAIDKSIDVPEFWVRRGVALDMQGRWGEASESFGKALELARANARIWFYMAYHQSLNVNSREQVQNSIENCLRLDPGNRSALALRQRLNALP